MVRVTIGLRSRGLLGLGSVSTEVLQTEVLPGHGVEG